MLSSAQTAGVNGGLPVTRDIFGGRKIFDQRYQFAALRPVLVLRKHSEQSQRLNIFTPDRHSPSLTRNIASYGKTAGSVSWNA
jgi:hypothetical protein